MSRTSQHVVVGERTLELSNLKKVLYRDAGIIKAEVVQYYLEVAPTLLRYVRDRPLSMIRYPDGLDGERFFQKNRPDWAPPWIEHALLGEDSPVDYMFAGEAAVLVWLANLACLELHPWHARRPHYDRPDYLVFDLDPPDDGLYGRVVELALALREHLERHGYHPFVKTTGGKGCHILAPIEPRWTIDEVFEAAKALADPFVGRQRQATLRLEKKARGDRILIDIYRNRASQTIVAAYSLRGRPGAPVSMPLRWDRFAEVVDPGAFTIRTVLDHLRAEGDAWEPLFAYAAVLHTHRSVVASVPGAVEPGRTHKTPEQLAEYAARRDFALTAEPPAQLLGGAGNAFVVHRHRATRLHYDLRLERDGVLRSWAVPKGLPPRPGIKRLAIAVEEHPLAYLDFEGDIPKGEYGGGRMWVFARGKYETTKQKKNGFYFRLHGGALSGDYRIHHTHDNHWLLERVDAPQIDWLYDRVEPMLAEAASEPPDAEDYLYELKWDGIRALIALDEGMLTIRSRSGRDVTRLFPELADPTAFGAACGLFDGEVVCLDEEGRPDFARVISRLHRAGDLAVDLGRSTSPVYCYLFDCLYLDGRAVVQEPLHRRRAWLEDALRLGTSYRMSRVVEDGRAFFDAIRRMGLEGIMAKRRDSAYLPGRRGRDWLKIKVRHTADCLILGYTKGSGVREDTFGALHLGYFDHGVLLYRGKVGSGFSEGGLEEVRAALAPLQRVQRPVEPPPDDDATTTWVEPALVCEVEYASLTEGGTLREPVFRRLRPDLAP